MARHDALTAAVIAAERDADAEGWDGSHRLYALADRDTYLDVAYPLDEPPDLPPGTLVAIPLTPLGAAVPLLTELTKVTWPADVRGCVLVTEVSAGADLVSGPRGRRIRWGAAHLAVGVLRDGYHLSLLRFRDSPELRSASRAAGDVVSSLLASFGSD
ncbi:hypothetical protein ACIBEJ_15065 [Nonomuraea sp. NPDC050790]|uniref:hypothetical protein n=1 Tax=Nonomuraea sp. NPDC050790 TaxID=3364371 RepID=UPI00379C80D7